MGCHYLIHLNYGSKKKNYKNRLDYCWNSWKQLEDPFSERTLDYIKSIDVMEDIKMLDSSFKIRPICLQNMRISNVLLKQGALSGLSLSEIAKIWYRADQNIPSTLEKLVECAQRQAEIARQIRKAKNSEKVFGYALGIIFCILAFCR